MNTKSLCLPFLFMILTMRKSIGLLPSDHLPIFSLSFLCQGERGLDGFPGKQGETGEQVGGRWRCWAGRTEMAGD